MRALFILLVSSAAAFACGPIGMIPGGVLRGDTAEAHVEDWAAFDHCKDIQIETRGHDPYSINIWAAGTGRHLYMASGRGRDSAWVRHLDDDSLVRVKACGRIYHMRATHTRRPEDLEHFLSAVRAQVRLEARPGPRVSRLGLPARPRLRAAPDWAGPADGRRPRPGNRGYSSEPPGRGVPVPLP